MSLWSSRSSLDSTEMEKYPLREGSTLEFGHEEAIHLPMSKLNRPCLTQTASEIPLKT